MVNALQDTSAHDDAYIVALYMILSKIRKERGNL